MEGYAAPWTEWFDFDAGGDAQPWDYDLNQGDGAAEAGQELYSEHNNSPIAAPLGSAFEPLPFDPTWPLYDSLTPNDGLAEYSLPSMFESPDVNGQHHAQQFTLPDHSIYAKSLPHGALSDESVQGNTTGIEQPMGRSSLGRHGDQGKSHEKPFSEPVHKCICMICALSGTVTCLGERIIGEAPGYYVACRFPRCQQRVEGYMDYQTYLAIHERRHFGKAGDYRCLEEGCKVTTKKFADLRRHCTVRHCTNAERFPCPESGCKYSGDNGFTREDKLKSHRRNVHQGKPARGKALQPLKPKMEGSKVTKAPSNAGI